MNKKLLILLTAVSVLTLSGCGAPKAPQPSGQKVSVVEFAKQREAVRKEKVSQAKQDAATMNFRFESEGSWRSGK